MTILNLISSLHKFTEQLYPVKKSKLMTPSIIRYAVAASIVQEKLLIFKANIPLPDTSSPLPPCDNAHLKKLLTLNINQSAWNFVFEKRCFKFGTNYMHFHIFFQRAFRVHINIISDLDFQPTLKNIHNVKLQRPIFQNSVRPGVSLKLVQSQRLNLKIILSCFFFKKA